YLKVALESAKKFNSEVLLLGDSANRDLWPNHWDASSSKPEKYQAFLEHYIKMSDNPTAQDLSCWRRHFLLETWMKENSAPAVFLIDSDWVTFANYTTEVATQLPSECAATLMHSNQPADSTQYKWSASPHFSYWTIEALEEFTDFCIEAYKNESIRNRLVEKYQWHLEHNKVGGICDMTLLHLWYKQTQLNVVNLAQVMNGKVLDLTINRSTNYFESEYQMAFGLKKLRFKNGVPYGYNRRLQSEVRFLGLHCQGGAKVASRFLGNSNLRGMYYLSGAFLIAKRNLKYSLKKLLRRQKATANA
ncbi:MAG: hypothetical protein WBA76_06245, partial [Phormidesmis sp.]